MRLKTLSLMMALFLAMTLVFTGCTKGDTANQPNSSASSASSNTATDPRVGSIHITSGGKAITPDGYRVFEMYEDGKIDDLQAPYPWELEPQLPTLTYAEDFKVSIDGGKTFEEPDFFEFDEDFSAVYDAKDVKGLAPGKHTVVVGVNWGEDAMNFTTYWYYFNLEIAG